VEQTDLLKRAVEILDQLSIPYAIVGAFASGVWGESRFTQDIDILVAVTPSQASALCKAFPAPDFYANETAAQEAVTRRSQFNVIHPASGNKIDFMIAGATPWSLAQLQRRKRVAISADHDAAFAAPEDVILGKLLYYAEGGSEKHLRDITGILKISGDSVDRQYVSKFASELGVFDIWEAVLTRVG
jgi:hypothetical protein